MWIVKLGGSLLGSSELKYWLQLFAQFGDGKIVIVPGGGLFADAVRVAQQESQCSDAAAHRMAVMAMDQYGVLLADLNPALVTANSELEIAERGWQHRAIVWLPSAMVLADDTIPTSWQMTSDSLAAWLATKLNARHLVLVKSQRPAGSMDSTAILSQQDVVDECLGDYIAGQSFETWIVGKQDYTAFEQGLSPEILKRTGLKIQPN